MGRTGKESSGIRLKTPDDIKRIREAGIVIAEIFSGLSNTEMCGVSTSQIDSYIDSQIIKRGCRASFKTFSGYAHSSCISVNNEAVHGIPRKKKIIQNGDIVKIDIGVSKNGFFADACRTFSCGDIRSDALKIVDTAKTALTRGLSAVFPGSRLGDIGYAIQSFVESRGCSVVREFCGHGVGFAAHEAPSVLHYGKSGSGIKIEPGLVIAVEPIVNLGGMDVKLLSDGWTAVTKDGNLSAQFEDTIAVTENGSMILTRF